MPSCGLSMISHALRAIATLVLGLALPACAPKTPPTGATLEAVRRAMAEGDGAALHALGTSETQALYTEEELATLVAENRAELAQMADALGDAEGRLSVELRYEGGERVVLRYEDGAYRLDGALLAGTSLGSPEEAVLALRVALERRSLPGVLRVLTTERRRALLGEIDALVDGAADPLDFDVRINGDRATVRLPTRLVIILERESDEWRVVDIAEDARR